MDETKKEVETKTETASAQQPEVTPQDNSISIDPTVDYQTLLEQKNAEIASLTRDRDNYKKGLLKSKGKITEEEPSSDVYEQPQIEEIVAKQVQEALHAAKLNQIEAEKNALIEKALRENKELKIALANKQGISTAPSGTSSDTSTSSTSYWSPDQIKELKDKGFTDEMIRQAAQNAKR